MSKMITCQIQKLITSHMMNYNQNELYLNGGTNIFGSSVEHLKRWKGFSILTNQHEAEKIGMQLYMGGLLKKQKDIHELQLNPNKKKRAR